MGLYSLSPSSHSVPSYSRMGFCRHPLPKLLLPRSLSVLLSLALSFAFPPAWGPGKLMISGSPQCFPSLFPQPQSPSLFLPPDCSDLLGPSDFPVLSQLLTLKCPELHVCFLCLCTLCICNQSLSFRCNLTTDNSQI